MYKKHKTFKIKNFDYHSYLEANPDIMQAIKEKQFLDAEDHLIKFGYNEIKFGNRKYHLNKGIFSYKEYIQKFSSLSNIDDAFEHFCLEGYTELIRNILDIEKINPEFHIDNLSDKYISGWIFDKNKLDRAMVLGLYINNKLISKVTTTKREDIKNIFGATQAGFRIDLPEKNITSVDSIIELKILFEDTVIPFLEEILYISPVNSQLEQFINLQNILKSQDNPSSSFVILRKEILPQIINNLRKNHRKKDTTLKVHLKNQYKLKNSSLKYENIIDIIIPIYRDVEVTQNCIESVINSKSKQAFQLILINDKSPDEDMNAMLSKYSNINNITILENQENLGFIGTVNKGMLLHNNRDVILLNSDTITTNFWIDKLNKNAYSSVDIATVTPLSNKATILSYPVTLVDNELPNNMSAEDLNTICHLVNKGLSVDLPTAHGFCMYIKREALNELGLFDEKTFGKGYGEENDFSLRAISYGWRNVAACDTFIEHLGSVSFSNIKNSMLEKNLKILNDIYPEYHTSVEKFIQKDSLYIARRNISKEIFKRLSNRYILFITHSLGGGTEVATKELSKLLKKEAQYVLVLECQKNSYLLKSYEEAFTLKYNLDEWHQVLKDLKDLKVWHIHYHHLHSFEWNISQLAEELNIEYDFTIHDYMPICPRINLTDETEEYCNEPDVKICNKCIEFNGVYAGLESKYKEIGRDVSQWRGKYEQFLKNSRKVLVPNEDVYKRISSYFALENLVLKVHPEIEKKIEFNKISLVDRKIKVAIIGAINHIKGYARLKECIHHAWKHDLPIEFIIIGYTVNDDILLKYSNVTITGRYEHNGLKELLEKHSCQIALFLSIWPETFSYTFSEALKSKLYPISFDIGAIANRMKEINFGELISLDSNAKEINQTILNVSKKNIYKKIEYGKVYKTILDDYYEMKE